MIYIRISISVYDYILYVNISSDHYQVKFSRIFNLVYLPHLLKKELVCPKQLEVTETARDNSAIPKQLDVADNVTCLS